MADTITTLGKRRTKQREAVAATTEKLAAAVRDAVAAGMTEVDAARAAGVDRMTVRRWLGKL